MTILHDDQTDDLYEEIDLDELDYVPPGPISTIEGMWMPMAIYDKMMAALNYYADPKNWENGIMPYHRIKPPIPAVGIQVRYKDMFVYGVPDGGRMAREALQ